MDKVKVHGFSSNLMVPSGKLSIKKALNSVKHCEKMNERDVKGQCVQWAMLLARFCAIRAIVPACYNFGTTFHW